MDALMRPGRIDKIIHITYADSEALYELFLQYYPGNLILFIFGFCKKIMNGSNICLYYRKEEEG